MTSCKLIIHAYRWCILIIYNNVRTFSDENQLHLDTIINQSFKFRAIHQLHLCISNFVCQFGLGSLSLISVFIIYNSRPLMFQIFVFENAIALYFHDSLTNCIQILSLWGWVLRINGSVGSD